MPCSLTFSGPISVVFSKDILYPLIKQSYILSYASGTVYGAIQVPLVKEHIINVNIIFIDNPIKSPILDSLIWKETQMTDMSKYKNVSLTKGTYKILEALSKVLLPDAKLSVAKTIESLANEKARKLNGKVKNK